MPEFILDTSGAILQDAARSGGRYLDMPLQWRDLDAFTQGYIEALFFTENAPGITKDIWAERVDGEGNFTDDDGDSVPMEGNVPEDAGFADLAPATIARIVVDCVKFQASEAYQAMQSADDQDEFPDNAPSYACDRHAGRDFWYTRNGHGCGFWDGDWPEPHATALDAACDAFGEVWVYLGDDGKVHLS